MPTKRMLSLVTLATGMILAPVVFGAQDEVIAQLAKEVGGKRWIVYAARGENGAWDLFLMRPNGSRRWLS